MSPWKLVPWLFFLSGAAGLTFELIWTRQLSLSLGCTVTSAALVSGVFLLGLGIGARWGERLSHAPGLLRVFAGLELCIAVSGLAVVAALPHSAVAVAALWKLFGSLALARLLVCLLALSLPCLCMGASLPVLCALLSERGGALFLASLGRLYAINTVGAVAGVLLCDGVLIPNVGIWNAGLAAAALDSLVAGLALILAGRVQVVPEAPLGPARTHTNTNFRLPNLYLVCWGVGLAGTWLQVAWTRILIVFQGSEQWAFSGCLASYLGCLALGGAVASQLRRGSLVALFWAASLTTLVSLACLPWARTLNPWLANLLVIGPTGLCLGLAFPLISDEIKKHGNRVADCTGWALLANTVGSLTGALLTAFVLIPRVGVQNTLGLAALWLALLALALQPFSRHAAVSLAMILGVATSVVGLPPNYLRALFFPNPNLHFVFTGEDSYGSVALVSERDELGEPIFQLLVDGFNMMGNDLFTQRYATALAAFPSLFQSHPRRALVICLGMAHSVNTALRDPRVEAVDCVELSPVVIEALSQIEQGQRAMADPKLQLILNDGRQHLVSTSKKYHLITAEPPPPNRAGAVNLYTREFYQLYRQHLEPGGIAVQWLPIFQMSRRQTRTIIRAFLEVFPHTYLVEGCAAQMGLVGSVEPITIDYPELSRRVASQPHLAATGWDRPELFVAAVVAGPKTLTDYTQGTPPLTDDWPILQYSRETWDPDFASLLLGEHPSEIEIKLSEEPTRRALEQAEITRARRCLRGLRRFLCQDWVPSSELREPRGELEREILARMAVRNYPNNAYVRKATQTTSLLQANLNSRLQNRPDSQEWIQLQARVCFRLGQNREALRWLDRVDLAGNPGLAALRLAVLWELGQPGREADLLPLAALDRAYLQRLFQAP